MRMDMEQVLITHELVEKKVGELVMMGLPTEAIATELLARATTLMIPCTIEQARESAVVFWTDVFAGIRRAVNEQRLPADVIRFPTPANLA